MQWNRRQLLKGIASLGGAGAFAAFRARAAATPPAARPGFQGRLIARNDADYEQWRRNMSWHLSVPGRHPALIAQARDAGDVASAVRLAARRGLRVAVRSSGHNGAGSALREGGMLLDLSLLKGISIDADRRVARVGASVWAQQLLHVAGASGLGFPAAHCPTVALGGYLLGGGLGWNHTRWGGFACQSVLGADVVLADGRAVHASATEHPDLFWALRGAGPGFFGAVTAFDLRLHPLPALIMGSTYVHPLSHVPDIAAELGKLSAPGGAPVEILTLLMHAPGAPPGAPADQAKVCFIGISAFADSEAQAREWLTPFAAGALGREALFKEEMQTTTFAKLYNPEQVDTGRGRYAVDNAWTDQPGAALIAAAQHMVRAPSSRSHAVVSWGIDPALRDDACLSRAARGYGAAYVIWDDPAADGSNRAWLDDLMGDWLPLAQGHYVNEIADDRHPLRVRASFSDAAWSRLAWLRGEFDPGRRFHGWLGADA